MRRQGGFNLLDLLIGVVISMFGLLAVAVTFRDFGQQRTTQVNASESQTNGTMALYLIERDLGQAGYGMMGLQNCSFINYYYSGTGYYTDPYVSTNVNTALTTLPVQIVDGGASSDTIHIQYGNSASGATGSDINTANTYPAGYAVTAAVGFAQGDLAVSNIGGICTLVAVTNTNPVASPIEHATTSPYNVAAAPGGTGWNSVLAADLASTPKPMLVNLGGFVSRQYSVAKTNETYVMTARDLPFVAAASAVVDEIVFLKAQYGMAATCNGTKVVSTWVSASTVIDNTNACRVIAVRVGVVARSPIYEKAAVAPASITVLPAINGGAALAPPGVAGTCATNGTLEVICKPPDDHYRYRNYSTIIPLKNVIWN